MRSPCAVVGLSSPGPSGRRPGCTPRLSSCRGWFTQASSTSVILRKNPHDLLTAFLLAFKDRPDVTLVLKLATTPGYGVPPCPIPS